MTDIRSSRTTTAEAPAFHHGAMAGHGNGSGFTLILLVLVLAAVVYGVVRLRMRRGLRGSGDGAGDRWVATAATDAPIAAAGAGAPTVRRGTGGSPAVETHGLIKRFGANVAVNDVELLVPRAGAFGYLGPNGAGKPNIGL
jgi:hypothetical protein